VLVRGLRSIVPVPTGGGWVVGVAVGTKVMGGLSVWKGVIVGVTGVVVLVGVTPLIVTVAGVLVNGNTLVLGSTSWTFALLILMVEVELVESIAVTGKEANWMRPAGGVGIGSQVPWRGSQGVRARIILPVVLAVAMVVLETIPGSKLEVVTSLVKRSLV
jgi:hypothetical protein